MNKKMTIRPSISGLQVKEDGKLIALVATTHPDRVGDILSKESLTQIVGFINDSTKVGEQNGHYRGLSLFHDWIHKGDPSLDEAGFMSNAKLKELDNGHFGVEVEVEINKYYNSEYEGQAYDAERIGYEVEHDKIGGLSIEYNTDDAHSRDVSHNGETYRFIEELTEFGGAAFARSRMIANPHAVIMKEIVELVNSNKEENIMVEENIDVKSEEVSEIKIKEDVEATENVEETEPVVEKEEPEAELEVKEDVVKKVLESKEFKEKIENISVDNKVIKQVKEDNTMNKGNLLIKEANEHLDSKDYFAFKEVASNMLNASNIKESVLSQGIAFTNPVELKVKCKGSKLVIVGNMQTKDILDTETNPSTYTQRSAEFNDVFVPGLIESFNEKTDTFSIMEKRDHMEGTDYFGWTITTSQDSGLSVDVNDPTVAKESGKILKLRTQIKEYRKGIEITDYVLYHSRASLGDYLMTQANKKMADLRKDLNKDLFTEQADDTTKILGFPAVADSAGNTSLYGFTRTAANRLAPDAAADTYNAVAGPISTVLLRGALRTVEVEGAERGNLMIAVNPKQRDAIFELLGGQQQLFTNPDFGFAGAIRFDGVPVIPDSDCGAGDLFVIDRSVSYIVMSKMPQLNGLAKVAASESLFAVTYLANVYELPRRIHQLATLS